MSFSDCDFPLGMESKTIPDSAIKATTAVSMLECGLFLAALMLANSCWRPQVSVRQRYNDMSTNCRRQIELVPNSRQRFVHTPI